MKALSLLLLFMFTFQNYSAADDNRIQPYKENPRYWQYEDKPVVLLGGTVDDNLFQHPQLEQLLDQLQSVGGNYIRNTMSDRNDQGFEVYAFKKLDDGKYDLAQWNEEYWQRFENMLQWTSERDIIVQIEVWDRFDYTDQGNSDRWQIHPYNPKNNITYTYKETGFVERYPDHPGQNKHHFFYSVPGMDVYDKKYDVFRAFQESFVAKMLSHSLQYNNVLYCMNNETDAPAAWGQYWMRFINEKAKDAGKEIMITDMFDDWDIKGEQHHAVYKNPAMYTFIDVSQNNHNKGEQHWDNIQWLRQFTAESIRPINTVKIYGADTGRFGNSVDGQERFWRNIFGGMAGTRFHRPDSGLGFSEIAQTHIKSMRMLQEKLDIFNCTPDAKSELLRNREDKEAYLTYNKGKQYAVFFPHGGEVEIDLSAEEGEFKVEILNNLLWKDMGLIKGGEWQPVNSPDEYSVVLITDVTR